MSECLCLIALLTLVLVAIVIAAFLLYDWLQHRKHRSLLEALRGWLAAVNWRERNRGRFP